MTSKAKPSLLSQLAPLTRAIVEANQRARAVELEHRSATAEAEDFAEGRIRAFATGDEDLAERLQAERLAAEHTARDTADRVRAARMVIENATADRQAFVTRNLDALLAEHEHAAAQAVDLLNAALDGVQAALAQYREAEARSLELMRLAGRGHRPHHAAAPRGPR